MKFKFYSCDDQFIEDNKLRILEVAKSAFKEIPDDEVLSRFSKYDEILLFFDKGLIIGFSFYSYHYYKKTLLVGARLIGVHQDYLGQGIFRRATITIFFHIYFRMFYELMTLKIRRMYLFSRQCNAIAYKLLTVDQDIYPDLIKKTKQQNQMPEYIKNLYSFLKSELDIDNLCVDTGVVFDGAVDAGIISAQKNSIKDWATPWDEYVPKGSELISVFRIGILSPFFNLLGASKRIYRIMYKQVRGVIASLIVIALAFFVSLIGIILIKINKKNLSQKLITKWAILSLKIYKIKINIIGNIDLDVNHVFAARHSSLLDTILYPAILPEQTVYIMKKELTRLPLVSIFMKQLQSVFLDRKKAIESIRSLKKLVKEIESDQNIFIHPEGTRVNESKLGVIHPGLYVLSKIGLNITTMSSFGGQKLWPKGHFFPKQGQVDVFISDSFSMLDTKELLNKKIKENFQDHINNNS